MQKYILHFTDKTTYSFMANDPFHAESRAQEIAQAFGKIVGYYGLID